MLAFVHEVNRTVWRERKTFLLMTVLFTVVYIIMVGFLGQEEYTALGDTLQQTGGNFFDGALGAVEGAGVLLMSLVSASTTAYGDEAQQVISGLLFLLLWLCVVWFLRNRLANRSVKLRDALYNSGAPLLSTLAIGLIIGVQLLPLGIAMIGYYAAVSSGLLESGIPAMLFWIAAVLLGLLTAYWLTSSMFATVIVTLPGMYPLKAIRSAGDIVLGRRVRILMRWLVMLVVVGLWWLVIMVPLILLEQWLRSMWTALATVPIVPVAVVIMTVLTAIWAATYVYLFYRKVVDNAA